MSFGFDGLPPFTPFPTSKIITPVFHAHTNAMPSRTNVSWMPELGGIDTVATRTASRSAVEVNVSVAPRTGTLAVTESPPKSGPKVCTVVATPAALVRFEEAETDPSPETAAQFTVTPGTGFPNWSRTSTMYGTGRGVDGAPFCWSPAFLEACVGVSGSAVAVNVVVPPPALARTVWAPAIGPSVHVTLAWPAASVMVV